MAASSKSEVNITLFRGWDDRGKYVWSPFVTKLEFRLRTSNVPYTCGVGSISSGPKGKIPYIELSSPSSPAPEVVGDSTLILKRLIEEGIVQDLNGRLRGKEKGLDLAVRSLLEDKLYFYHGYERWVKNFYAMRDHAMWSIPWPMRVLVGALAYRGNVRKLFDQGTGRFSDEEILGFKTEIWEGIEEMLRESRETKRRVGGKDGEAEGCWWVLGGEQPTEADAVLYGFVVSVLVCDAGPESRKLLKEKFGDVVEWAGRIHKRWFPDYEIWE